MTPFDMKRCLESAVLLVDTREQDTPSLRRRISAVGLPFERAALNAGDYSLTATAENGTRINCERLFAIERKMSADELAGCFTRDRDRFEREFERAASAGTKMYIVCENTSWENIYNGRYRSQMKPQAFTASIFAWMARYGCPVIFCKAETSGRVIHDILYRELKERLERGDLNAGE